MLALVDTPAPKRHFQPSGQREGLPTGARLHRDEIFQDFGQGVGGPNAHPLGDGNRLLFPGVTFPLHCKYFVFSFVDVISSLDYLGEPNGTTKKHPSVRNRSRLI